MSKDQKDLLKRLDVLNNNIELLGKIIAVNVGKETFFKENKQKEQQIAFLAELGLPRNIIASMVVTTPLTVSVTKSQKKPKKKPLPDKAEPKEVSAEKTSGN
ncbi:MAG: hypothetical protein ABSF24_06405 [Candidatus Bathyarchaeia archaeon]|jgi:hypothetical protein